MAASMCEWSTADNDIWAGQRGCEQGINDGLELARNEVEEVTRLNRARSEGGLPLF